jgi:hypothetical protein
MRRTVTTTALSIATRAARVGRDGSVMGPGNHESALAVAD